MFGFHFKGTQMYQIISYEKSKTAYYFEQKTMKIICVQEICPGDVFVMLFTESQPQKARFQRI